MTIKALILSLLLGIIGATGCQKGASEKPPEKMMKMPDIVAPGGGEPKILSPETKPKD